MDAKTRAKVERYQMNKKFRERQMRKLGKIKKKEIKRESDSSDSDDAKNKAKDYFGIYRDDFYDEINIATLIGYYRKNEEDFKTAMMLF